jgi:hypothetical protein
VTTTKGKGFWERLDEYHQHKDVIRDRRAALREARSKIDVLAAQADEDERVLLRAKKSLLELSAQLPGLLHAEVAGIVGRLEPELGELNPPTSEAAE